MFLRKAILALLLGLSCVAARRPIRTKISPKPSPYVSPISLEQAEVTRGINQFADELYKVVAKDKPDGNLIMSLPSIHTVLSMAAYGAGGNTMKQMRRSLHLPRSIKVALKGYNETLASYQGPKGVELKNVNNITIADDMRLSPGYRKLMRSVFKSEITSLNMRDPEEAAKTINEGLKKITNGAIQEIVQPEDIGAETSMILINAIYFKGNWAKKFNEDFTERSPFKIGKDDSVDVPTMFVTGSFRYGTIPELNATFVALPYENENFSMIIVVPEDINGLNHIVQNLDSSELIARAARANQTPIELRLPKFKIESTTDLIGPLSQLHMTDMFEASANFSYMTEKSSRASQIGQVRQKATIEVDEKGSEASAVAAMTMYTRSNNFLEVEVNKPFFFMIAMGEIPLFTGHIKNPIQDDYDDGYIDNSIDID